MPIYDVGDHAALVGKSQTNSGTNEVFADSGALDAPSGYYIAWVVVALSVAGRFEVARRNVANSADVGPVVVLRCAAGTGTAEYKIRFRLEPGERIVVRTPAAITGDVDAFLCVEGLL